MQILTEIMKGSAFWVFAFLAFLLDSYWEPIQLYPLERTSVFYTFVLGEVSSHPPLSKIAASPPDALFVPFLC